MLSTHSHLFHLMCWIRCWWWHRTRHLSERERQKGKCRKNVNVTIFRALMFPYRHTRSRSQRNGKWMNICVLYLCGCHLTFVSMHWYVKLCLGLICIRNEIHFRCNLLYFCLAAETIRTCTEDILSQNILHSHGCIAARIRTHGTWSGERRGKISMTSTKRCKRWQLSGMYACHEHFTWTSTHRTLLLSFGCCVFVCAREFRRWRHRRQSQHHQMSNECQITCYTIFT